MSDKVKKFLLLSSVVVIIILVAFVAYYAKQNSTLKDDVRKVQDELAQAQAPSLEPSLVMSKVSTKTATPTSTLAPKVSPSPEKSKVDLIKEAYAKEYSSSVDSISVTISKESENSAYGSVSVSGEGGWLIAAKKDGAWKIVASGNGTINCDKLEGYDIPSSVVEQCYDVSSDSFKNR